MKSAAVNLGLLVVSILLAVLLAEGAAQLYVYQVAQRGKLFEPDPVTGWRVKPNLSIQRRNADGDLWLIETDGEGFRRRAPWKSDGRRALILGDSYAFGEGVNHEDRFDQALEQSGYSVLNTGVMGFGTDQQFLRAGPYLEGLGAGDVVVLLTYFNDFYDLPRRQHSGRAKPWYELDNDGRLQLRGPVITLREKLRDRSYLYAAAATLLARGDETTDDAIEHAVAIYRVILDRGLEPVVSRGVVVILVYHGVWLIDDEEQRTHIERALMDVCAGRAVRCLNLDDRFRPAADPEYFLADGHWSAAGHAAVGRMIVVALADTPGGP